MVNPNVLASLNGDGITGASLDLGDLQVTYDNVARFVDLQSNAIQCSTSVFSENGLIATDCNRLRSGDNTVDDDNLCCVVFGSKFKGSKRSDGHDRSSSSTLRSSIESGISDCRNFVSGCTTQEDCSRRSLNSYCEPQESVGELHNQNVVEESKEMGNGCDER